MCGIVGSFAYQDSAKPPSVHSIERACEQMNNRGPDGKGTWISSDKSVIFGHRRLSIIDISDASSQPMIDEELSITYNGEIYNFEELRDDLCREGVEFRTNGDTEVLLKLFRQRGVEMLRSLRGMFAFAIYDSRKRTLFAARDHNGIKPFYYTDTRGTFSFSSSLRALLAGGLTTSEISDVARSGFLFTGTVPEPHTILTNTFCLEAGHWIMIESGKRMQIHRWSHLPDVFQAASSSFDLSAHAEALRDSVRMHMVADCPVGLFLSAGIDSTAILAMLKDTGFEGTRTITAGFDDKGSMAKDESNLAHKTAVFYGAQHLTRTTDQNEFEEDLPLFINAMEQPTIDGLNTWFVAKAAKENGLRVCLSGLGADELFGGYPSFFDVPRWRRQWAWLGDGNWRKVLFSRLALGLESVLPNLPPKALSPLAMANDTTGSWIVKRSLFQPWEIGEILGHKFASNCLTELGYEDLANKATSPKPENEAGEIMLLESGLYMRNQLLRDSDWAAMAHSIEVRVPFVDFEVQSKMATPMAQRRELGKKFLTQFHISGFPSELIDRPKSGFTLPHDQWTRGSINGLQHRYGKKRVRGHWSRRWSLEVLERYSNSLTSNVANFD